MLKSTKLTRNLAKLMLVAVLFVGCSKKQTDENIKLKIGKEYIISFDWEEENPFKQKYIDTVKITGLKGDYVQWQYRNGFKQSSSIRLFSKLVKKQPLTLSGLQKWQKSKP